MIRISYSGLNYKNVYFLEQNVVILCVVLCDLGETQFEAF